MEWHAPTPFTNKLTLYERFVNQMNYLVWVKGCVLINGELGGVFGNIGISGIQSSWHLWLSKSSI
jgi:uncharacterized protein GlcG (DUF336 family)